MEAAAKWPPDPSPPLFSQQNLPHYSIDDFTIDSNSFDNGKAFDADGNGNAVFDKTIASLRTLQDNLPANDVVIPDGEERRLEKVQWLGNWLFENNKQQLIPQSKQTTQGRIFHFQNLMPQEQQQQPQQQQGQQQLQLWLLNGHRKQDSNIFVHKKSPELLYSKEDASLHETDISENDVTDANSPTENIKAENHILNIFSVMDKSDGDQTVERSIEGEQISQTKRIPFERIRRLDYSYIPYTAYKNEQERKLNEAKKLAYKRNKTGNGERKQFLPSISAGAMTQLGNFFTDLSKNVRYNEKTQPLGHPQAKLLEGQHPLRQLHEKITGEHEANAEFLHAIRTYRPSQKIRSLVSMNPRGYHGAQFIDPNYMWVGLGK